jgi:hypothetical protein
MADMDTAQKRFSTLDWDQPFQPGIGIPSGSDTVAKRLHGLWTYSGIEPPAGQLVGLWHSLQVTSHDTTTSGYDVVPFVVRNRDQAQVIQADVDPT